LPSNVLTVTTPLSLPLAPTGIAGASSAPGILPFQVTVNWADVAFNEATYTVQRKVSAVACTAGGVWATLNAALPADSIGFVDTTAISGNQYCYRVQAVNTTGASAWNMTVNPITTSIAVSAPTTLTATPNAAGTTVALRWIDTANNETAYLVEQSTDGVTFTAVTTLVRTAAQRTGVNAAVLYNAVVTAGSLYTFRVTALNVTAGVASASASVTATANLGAPAAPADPTGLAVVLTSAINARLTWTDNAITESGYIVEVATDGGAFAALPTINRTAAQRTATGLVTFNTPVLVGHTYAYRVKAVATAFGLSTPSVLSNQADLNTAIPAAPASVVSAQGAPGSIVVSWVETSNNETGFTVQRSRLVLGIWTAWANVGTVAANVTTLTDAGLISGRTYRYQVRANSLTGNSVFTGPSADAIVP
jgi:large repetitive protein